MYQVVTKQRSLKQPLKQLNRAKFADVEKAVEVAKLKLSNLQIQMHGDPSNHTILQEESAAAEEYMDLCKANHSYLSQKAKVGWLCEGDENTKYFHNQIRARQMHNKILQIKDKNRILHTDPHNIERAFLEYYKDLQGDNTDTLDVNIPTVRTGSLISDHHRSILLKPVSAQDVMECIFSIPATKSPGPDGFTNQFYRDSWAIIGKDITGAVVRPKIWIWADLGQQAWKCYGMQDIREPGCQRQQSAQDMGQRSTREKFMRVQHLARSEEGQSYLMSN
ncbi:uncharacterized protein LOC141638916 [Silene latifolia]|uniref:uncharacterized protein LOC141638916 n=1 Tax=Silene latifolia TaxID=37657 RepID=UPI003D76B750